MVSTLRGLTQYEANKQQRAASDARNQKYKDEIKARVKAIAASLEAAEAQQAKEKVEADKAKFKADELQKYLVAGGSEDVFNVDWPKLRHLLVEQRYLDGRNTAPTPDNASVAKKTLGLFYSQPSSPQKRGM